MNKFISTAIGMVVASNLYAGSMGKIKEPINFYTFFGFEGGYTWNKLQGFNFATTDINRLVDPTESDTFPLTESSTSPNNSGGSARLSAGIMRSLYQDVLYFSSELGLGYYGQTTQYVTVYAPNSDLASIIGLAVNLPLNFKIAGFDALLGLTYNQEKYDLFIKGGALLRNTYFKTNLQAKNLPINKSTSINALLIDKMASTQFLPMIKTGATYHYNDNLGVTLSYAHAFSYASSRALSIEYSVLSCPPGTVCIVPPPLNINLNSSYNTSLDMILAGIQYRFD